jgi:uncharacterized protein YndB with AHSA1/START domain
MNAHSERDDARARTPLGELLGDDGIRFVRILNAPVERVWKALVSPEGLREWLGEATVDARLGGAFEIRWDETDAMHGHILEFEQPTRLVIAWHETSDGEPRRNATAPDDRSHLSFTLEPFRDGTRLTLIHRLLRRENLAGIGGGWHSHLDALASALQKGTLDIEQRYALVLPDYEALITAAS